MIRDIVLKRIFPLGHVRVTELVFRLLGSAPVILVFAMIVLSYAVSAPYYYNKFFGHYDAKNINSLIFLDTFTFICFFLTPLVTSQLIFRENPRDIGLRLPVNNKTALKLIVFALCFIIPITLYCAHLSQFKSYYSLGQINTAYFILIQLTILPTFYFCEEFFFRGFLFLILWRKLGWHSFWITDIFFTLAHIGKPGTEILLSIPGSVVLNYLTLKTKSIFPAMIVHFTIGVLMNVLVNYHFLNG